jgi:hypothetical protein
LLGEFGGECLSSSSFAGRMVSAEVEATLATLSRWTCPRGRVTAGVGTLTAAEAVLPARVDDGPYVGG